MSRIVYFRSLPSRARATAAALALLAALPVALLSIAPSAHAAAPQRALPKYKTSMPPSADLAYSIKARQKGLDIAGSSTMQWTVSGNRYSITAETRAMLVGKILDETSEGTIDDYGLAPSVFTEKRFRKEPTTASFNRQTRTISFSGAPQTFPIKGGEQDRLSIVWQLAAVARAAPAKFKSGSAWMFFVVGQEDAEPWTFKVGKPEKLRTPEGDIEALHIMRDTGADAKGRRLDLWLAPSMEWYPVRLRFTDADGDYIEQTLEELSRK
jgi:hypothetical protein